MGLNSFIILVNLIKPVTDQPAMSIFGKWKNNGRILLFEATN